LDAVAGGSLLVILPVGRVHPAARSSLSPSTPLPWLFPDNIFSEFRGSSSDYRSRMIEFRALGAIELRNETGRELAAVLAQPKRLALLIYLAVTPGFSRRDKLVGLLWPEFDQSRARQALNKAVHHLRQSLGDAAIVSRGDQELALEPSVVECDVRRFESALASGDPATALNLYRGALADGLFVSEAEEFERWLSAERERMRTEAASAAGALADRDASVDSSRAVDWARRAVELSPFDEPAVRRLMSLLARSGEVAGAAVAYDDLVRRLSKGLDVAPSAETRALRDSIGDLGGLASPAATPAVPVESSSSPAASSPTVVGPTSSPRRASRLIASVGAAACVVLALGGIAFARRAGATLTNAPLGATRLLVSVLENRTGDSTLNRIGVMAADWMIQGLSVSDSIHVVDSRAALFLARTVGRTTAQLADAAGARFVIAGAYYKEGDSLSFMARLSDATSDGQEWTFKPVAVPIDRPEAARLSLQDQARTLVAQAAFPQIGDMLRTRAAPLRYDAYREYVRGVDYFVRRDEGNANEHFLMAARLDTTFAEALLNAVTTQSLRGTPTADSIMQVLARRREQLSPMSRLWFDATEAAHRGDPAAMRHYGELAHRYPDSFFAMCYSMELMAFRRVGEADSVLRSLDPNRGWLRGWFSYWPTRVMLDDMLDDVDAARADVVAGARAYPHNMGIAVADARYLARAGTPRQLDSLFDEAVALPAVGEWHAGEVLAAAALEAAAHGHGDWVPHIRDRALQWYASLPAAERGAERNSGFGLSWMLASVRAWPELRSRVATLLASTSTDSARWVRYEALAAAHVGDTATLTRLDRRLRVAIDRASDAPLGELLGERARIAALRGSSGEALDLLRQAFSHNKAFDVFIHTDPSLETIWSEPGFARLLVAADGGLP
jgi:DNA-binding SARP family transcriptional activator/TolB-like protein